jgi:shikimate kinase
MIEFPFSNLILVGFMGSGKSSVGRLLATQLGFQFVDTDALVVQATGMQISDLFGQFGEEFFREREAEALHSLVGREGLVVATGGGIVTRECNMPVLRSVGLVVALSASEDVIFERVSRNNKRPLLHTPNPRATVSELLADREPLYAAAAAFIVDTSDKTHAEVADAILQRARGWAPEEEEE